MIRQWVSTATSSRRMRAIRHFTLVEVAVSLLVIAVGFTTVLSIFPVGMQWTHDAIYQGSGLDGAQSVIKSILALTQNTVDVDSKYALNRALITNERYGSDTGSDYGDNHNYRSVFEVNGFFYTVEYVVKSANSSSWPTSGGNIDWELYETGSQRSGSHLGRLKNLDYNAVVADREPMFLRLRVSCYRAKPTSTNNSATPADKDLIGRIETIKLVTPLVS